MNAARPLLLLCGALLLAGVSAQPPPDPAQLERGSDLFCRRCSVCHAKTGLGFDEAREAFPESHRRCTQCHKSGGLKIMTIPFQDNNVFNVGDPPAPARSGRGRTRRRSAPIGRDAPPRPRQSEPGGGGGDHGVSRGVAGAVSRL